ncbi:hypothetical protein BLNAU_12477 [Blattamonas nauphoetae]|uniref:Uncharacterized protein n=1 Tax=Blattamonas nauphoetae TaxID=2049346 RepID=A0ABQ9XMA9_9EUKA|nr:hypothetical protein BLNAU_12477 [Blattamonas nauphoetae]
MDLKIVDKFILLVVHIADRNCGPRKKARSSSRSPSRACGCLMVIENGTSSVPSLTLRSPSAMARNSALLMKERSAELESLNTKDTVVVLTNTGQAPRQDNQSAILKAS